MGEQRPKRTPASGDPAPAGGHDLPERWSVKRKTELVLRLLRRLPGGRLP